MSVFVLGKNKKPLMPCSEKRARLLLSRGKAIVVRHFPFTIRLKTRVDGKTQPLQLKLDPGSKTSGLALVSERADRVKVLHLFHLQHRGQAIKSALDARRGHRRMRRAKRWYRPARFDNRVKRQGWLPPSLQHRVDTTLSLVNKLYRLAPVTDIAVESVKFDMQLMENPEISGVGYQQGTLAGYTVKEYLLEKHHRKCVYCSGASKDPILEVEHIHPKSKGGTDSIKNLTLSCKCCNQHKDADTLAQWAKRLGNSKLDIARKDGIKRVETGVSGTLSHAAAVNATRNRLVRELVATGIAVSTSTGAQTKLTRHQQNIPKDHCLDAVCVGVVTKPITDWQRPVLSITAMGRGTYQRAQVVNDSGLVGSHKTRVKVHFGFQTGDMVKAIIPPFNEKNKALKTVGTYVGRIAVRATPSVKITGKHGKIDGINPKYIRLIQRADGFEYKQTGLAV